MQIQKLKLGQQNNDEGSINLAGANKKATLKCKKIIIKTLVKLYNLSTVTLDQKRSVPESRPGCESNDAKTA